MCGSLSTLYPISPVMFHVRDRISYLKLNYVPRSLTSFEPLTKHSSSSHFHPKTRLGQECFAFAFSLARPSKTLSSLPSRTAAGLFPGARGLLNILCRTPASAYGRVLLAGPSTPHAASPASLPGPVLAAHVWPAKPLPASGRMCRAPCGHGGRL